MEIVNSLHTFPRDKVGVQTSEYLVEFPTDKIEEGNDDDGIIPFLLQWMLSQYRCTVVRNTKYEIQGIVQSTKYYIQYRTLGTIRYRKGYRKYGVVSV